MAVHQIDAAAITETAPVPRSKGRLVVNWITSTDHKTIGYMYLIASFTFFCPTAHKPYTAKNVVTALYDHVRDALDETGDAAFVAESLQGILDQGTGATRQRQAYQRKGSFADVVADTSAMTHEEAGDRHPRLERLLGSAVDASRGSGLAALSR